MGATAIDSPIGVAVFVVVVVFSPHLGEGCVFLVCVCFFRAFFGALVCVWNVFFA